MNIDLTKEEVKIMQIALMRLRGNLEEEIKQDSNRSEIISQMQKCDNLFKKTLGTID
jgi:hypothetical protein